MGEPVRVTVVALDPVLEAGVASSLRSCPDVAVALPGEEPDVAVVVLDAVGDQELALIRSLRDAPHRPEVVLIATDLAPARALHAIVAGARGLLRRREAGPDRLVRTVLAAASGDSTVPPDMLDGLLALTTPDEPSAGLSDREREVLRLVADGRETDDIARALCYSPRTVASILHDITNRFRLRNRAHAVAYALRAGLL